MTDDIDRELKRVQLLREQLALEQELRQRDRVSNLSGSAMRALACAMRALLWVPKWFGRVIGRTWKWLAIATILSGVALGAYTWQQAVDQEKLDAAEAKYEAAARKFVHVQCKFDRCEDPYYSMNDRGCIEDLFLRIPSCSARARSEFSDFWKAEHAGRIPAPPGLDATVRTRSAEAKGHQKSLYSATSGAFSDESGAKLWLTQIKARLGPPVESQRMSVCESEAGYHIVISVFGAPLEADAIAAKVRAAGIDMAVVLFEARCMTRQP